MSRHDHEAESKKCLKVGVITLSDTRSVEEDKSGEILKSLLLKAGHKIEKYSLSRENPEEIEKVFSEFLDSDLDAVVTNGGTGLTSRDGTIEVARKNFQKELPGFGELFRMISFQQIGPAAILSRSTAGLAKGKIVICLPGSSKAVKLATERIIIPQLPHMVREASR